MILCSSFYLEDLELCGVCTYIFSLINGVWNSLSLSLSLSVCVSPPSPQYGEAPPSSSSGKKRHYSAPSHGSAHNLSSLDQDAVESREWILPASLSFYVAQETVLLQSMIVEVRM